MASIDKVIKARELKKYADRYTSFYIRLYFGHMFFCSRWYGTYDRPDWDFYFTVTEEEADRLVDLGLAGWWWTRKDVVDKWRALKNEAIQ